MRQVDTKVKMVLNACLLKDFPVIVLNAFFAPSKVLKAEFVLLLQHFEDYCGSV